MQWCYCIEYNFWLLHPPSLLLSKGNSSGLNLSSFFQSYSRSIPEGLLVEVGNSVSPVSSPSASSHDSDLHLAMELSARAQEEVERKRKQEDEELERILQLSLTEKWKGERGNFKTTFLEPEVTTTPQCFLPNLSKSTYATTDFHFCCNRLGPIQAIKTLHYFSIDIF